MQSRGLGRDCRAVPGPSRGEENAASRQTALPALAAQGANGASRAQSALMSHLAEIVSAAGWKRPTSATTHQGNFMRGIILLALFILLAGCAGNTESTSPGAEPARIRRDNREAAARSTSNPASRNATVSAGA